MSTGKITLTAGLPAGSHAATWCAYVISIGETQVAKTELGVRGWAKGVLTVSPNGEAEFALPTAPTTPPGAGEEKSDFGTRVAQAAILSAPPPASAGTGTRIYTTAEIQALESALSTARQEVEAARYKIAALEQGNAEIHAGFSKENNQQREEIAHLKTYVIPEKDKHGRYWEDLAQTRIVDLRNAESAASALKEALARLEELATGEGWNTPVVPERFRLAVREARAALLAWSNKDKKQ